MSSKMPGKKGPMIPKMPMPSTCNTKSDAAPPAKTATKAKKKKY